MDNPQCATVVDFRRLPDELTVTTDDGELIASISFVEGNAIVANGYKVLGYE